MNRFLFYAISNLLLVFWLLLTFQLNSFYKCIAADSLPPRQFGTNTSFNDLQFRYGLIPNDWLKRAEYLDAAIMRIEADQSIIPEHKAECLMYIAQRYYSNDKTDTALSLFYKIVDMPIDDFRRADALRMIGQTEQYRKQNLSAATNAYAKLTNLLHTTEDKRLKAMKDRFAVDAITKGSQALESIGNSQGALEVRSSALTNDSLKLNSDDAAFLLVENGRSFRKLGKLSQSVEMFDELFSKFPNYGRSNGDIVAYKWERVRCFGYEKTDPRFAKEMQTVWDDVELHKYPQIFPLGQQLAIAYRSMPGKENRARLEQLLKSMIKESESKRTAFTKNERDLYNTDLIAEFALYELTTLHLRQSDTESASTLLKKALNWFPASEKLRSLQPELQMAIADKQRASRLVYTKVIKNGIICLVTVGIASIIVILMKKREPR